MKNIKRIVSLICVFMLLAPCCANARAVRRSTRESGASLDRKQKNDIMFMDFSGEGFPAAFTNGGGVGKIYIDSYEVMPKQEKNCLVIYDMTHEDAYITPMRANIDAGKQTGLVGVEIRYMYDWDPESPSTFGAFVMMLLDSAYKMTSRYVIASSGGASYFNLGGPSEKLLEATKIMPNTWYTIKWVLDLDNKRMDFTFLNEGTGAKVSVFDADWYDEGAGDDLARIGFESSKYGGKYVFDYVRVSRETERLEDTTSESEDDIADAGKGTVSEKVAPPVNKAIAGRINVQLDGEYKFTTQAPYEKDGKIMVTAKNIASFLGMSYAKEDSGCVIKTPIGDLTIKNGGSVLGDKSVQLLSEEKNGQIFVSVQDLCAAIGGYNCSYDSTAKTISITKAEVTTPEGGENIEK